MASKCPAPARFARRPRKNEGVDVSPRLSDDAGMRANRPGPKGCRCMAAMRQRAAWPAGQAGAAPRTDTWRPCSGNAGYLEAISRISALVFEREDVIALLGE